ncbi:MAG: ISNCY family transposase [Proteobacteria bacterium]|nr:ISNCY family transposase [Pseudomonadota bacterium]
MIVMDSKAQLIVDIIAKVAEGKISIGNGTKLLNKSRRTIERYLQQYQKIGIQFIVHKNTNCSPVNKTSDALKKQVQGLIKKKYFDFNLTHLKELLAENENIRVKRETLRGWAHEIHHVKRAKKRGPRVRKRRERMESPGLLLQMDGSPHRWFGDSQSCLIAIIDDATSEIHAEFFKSETTLGCMKVLKDLIAKKGVFKTLYVDRAGIFGGPKRCNFSQVQRACGELGIEIIFANSPEGKGRIERAFDTFQDRLIPELRLKNIKEMNKANQYLHDVFIPSYWNKQILVKPENISSEFTSIPPHNDLDDIFTLKEYRKIRNDHTFSYGNKFYLITSPLRYAIAKQHIEIRTGFKGDFDAYFAGERLPVSAVVEPKKLSMVDLEIKKKVYAILLAEQLQNVSEAARRSGVSRQTIYKNGKILKEKGPQALKRTFRKDHYHKNRADRNVEKAVIDFSLENPHLGQVQVALQLKEIYQIEISPAGVRYVWLRAEMQTIALRIQKSIPLAIVA